MDASKLASLVARMNEMTKSIQVKKDLNRSKILPIHKIPPKNKRIVHKICGAVQKSKIQTPTYVVKESTPSYVVKEYIV